MSKEIYGLHNHISTLKNKKEFLDEALKQNANVLAITDHRTLLSYYDLFSNLDSNDIDAYKKLKFIIGMELTGMFPFTTIDGNKSNIAMDILAYNLNIENYQEFYNFILKNYQNLAYLDSSQYQQEELDFVKKVAQSIGYKADYDNIQLTEDVPFAGYAISYGLTDQRYVDYNISKGLLEELKTNPRAFRNREMKNPDSKFFVDYSKFYPNMEKIIEAIHENEALVFFPHTAAYFAKSGDEEKIAKAWNNSYKITNDFLRANPSIDGLEIRHPSYLDNQEYYDYLENTAKTKDLFVSGGTDYHKNGEKITLDYNDKYIDNTALTNVNDWAIMYSLDEMIDLSKEIGKIENKEKQRILGK